MEHSDTPSPSPREVERWKALGGIDLSAIEDPEERFVTASHLRVGVHQMGTGFTFKCPMCGTTMLNDQMMQPLCTGPHPSLDEHPPTVMEYVR